MRCVKCEAEMAGIICPICGYVHSEHDLSPDELFKHGLELMVEHDHTGALQWFRLAAEQGHAGAQNYLGFMYEQGAGTEPDFTEALRWFRLAAEQGHAGAQNNLGNMYRYGEGLEQNFTEALKWYRMAAERGYAAAQNRLGYMFERGIGTEPDDAEAQKWYGLAAEQGYTKNILSFDDVKKKKYKEAFDRAEADRKKLGYPAESIRIQFEEDELTYDREDVVIAMFYDEETNVALLRRFWVDDFVLLFNTVENFDIIKKIAPKSLQELLDNGLYLYGGLKKTEGEGREPYYAEAQEGVQPAAELGDIKKSDSILFMTDLRKRKYNEAFDWVVSEQRRLGRLARLMKLDIDDIIGLDIFEEGFTASMFYNEKRKKALLRRTWDAEQQIAYDIVVNYDEAKEKAPKTIQALLDNGIKIYNMAKKAEE